MYPQFGNTTRVDNSSDHTHTQHTSNYATQYSKLIFYFIINLYFEWITAPIRDWLLTTRPYTVQLIHSSNAYDEFASLTLQNAYEITYFTQNWITEYTHNAFVCEFNQIEWKIKK